MGNSGLAKRGSLVREVLAEADQRRVDAAVPQEEERARDEVAQRLVIHELRFHRLGAAIAGTMCGLGN